MSGADCIHTKETCLLFRLPPLFPLHLLVRDRMLVTILAGAAAWQSRPAVNLCSRPSTLSGARARAPVAAATEARADSESTITTISGLLDDPRAFLQQAQEDPSTLLQLVKDAGIAGAISYTVVELSFFSIALPIGYFSWHASTDEWLQPLLLLQDVSDATHTPRANTHASMCLALAATQPHSHTAAQPQPRRLAACSVRRCVPHRMVWRARRACSGCCSLTWCF